MPNTVPNQRLVAIHRERASSDFLGIKNSHWQAAARDLGAHALMLYLYFASNANGFMLALSPAAIRQAVGMPSSTYRDQFVRLQVCGSPFRYLLVNVQMLGNRVEMLRIGINGLGFYAASALG